MTHLHPKPPLFETARMINMEYNSDCHKVPLQANTNQNIQDFRRFIKGAKEPGVRSNQNGTALSCRFGFQETTFIPERTLEAYLDIDRIEALLRSLYGNSSKLPLNANSVHKDCHKIFAILLYIGQGNWIKHFLDNRLYDKDIPFHDRPARWPEFSSPSDDFWVRFEEVQWEFCAHFFTLTDTDSCLYDKIVLPFAKPTMIVDNNDSGVVVFVVEFHQDYHDLHEGIPWQIKEKVNPNKFVIKSFDTNDGARRRCYDSENDSFKTLRTQDQTPDEIVGFFGSFILNGTCNIILEYADQGTLEQYFRKHSSPASSGAIVSFWKSMAELAKGLDKIHNIECSPQYGHIPESLYGFHQDLKPSNILVFSYGATSPYQYKFKIADLGLSHFIRTRYHVTSVSGHGELGTRTYGSPETYRAGMNYPGHMTVPQKSDVWSLACIYSVATSWAVGAQDHIDQFAQKRREARQALGLSQSDCFHDDRKLLPEVEEWHETLTERARGTDYVTSRIWSVLKRALTEEVNYRLWAAQLYHELGFLKHITSNAIQKPLTPHIPPRTPPNQIRKSHSMFENPYADADGCLLRESRESDRSTRISIAHPTLPISPPLTAHQSSREINRVHSRSSFVAPQGHLSGSFTAHGESLKRSQPVGLNISADLCQAVEVEGRIYASPEPSPINAQPQNHERQMLLKSSHVSPAAKAADETQYSTPPTEMVVQDTAPGSLVTPSSEELAQAEMTKSKLRCPTHRLDKVDYMSVAQLHQWCRGGGEIPSANLKGDLRKRDHVFLVDNARTMATHWPQLVELFEMLVRFVIDCDQDGLIELFSMQDHKPMKEKSIKRLVSAVESLGQSLNSSSNPETALTDIFDDRRCKTLSEGKARFMGLGRKTNAPLSVYILTDAVWQSRADLRPVIRKIVALLKTTNKPDNHVGIQFIQFGSDPELRAKLKAYDDLKDVAIDIVDTEPADGNVWKMLLGSINKSFDVAECTCH